MLRVRPCGEMWKVWEWWMSGWWMEWYDVDSDVECKVLFRSGSTGALPTG